MDSESAEAIAVYFHGRGRKGSLTWYRIVLEKTSSSPAPAGETIFPDTVGDEYDDIIGGGYHQIGDYHPISRHHPISLPVAVLPSDNADYGYKGGWAVIGDEIYWTGGWLCDLFRNFSVSNNLLKHNICLHQDKEEWEKVCTLTIPRRSPFITAVGRKIAIVGGTDDDDDRRRKCGEIYDLDKQTLDYLNSEINILKHYGGRATSVVEDDTQIVFFSSFDGSMLFLDASTGDAVKICDPDPLFAVRSPQATAPPPSLQSLSKAVGGSNAVFLNRTFYFFSSELVLYGYDVDRHKWFQSKCLLRKLHLLPIRHLSARRLIGLPNGNLLVIVSQVPPLFTMASLSVCKSDDDDDNVSPSTTLGVMVEHIQYFRPHDNFCLIDAKAISLKNTGSSTARG